MYYNGGDRQNSLSLIAVLITRLNTKAAIPYSLTCHRPHLEWKGTPLCHSAAHTHPIAANLVDVYACGSLHPSSPGKTIAWLVAPHQPGDTQLVSHPSGSFSRQMLGSPVSILGGTSHELPPTPGMLWWYPESGLQMFAQRMQGKNTGFPAHKLTLQKQIVMPQRAYVPKHEGFCPEDAAKAFTSGCEMHMVPITGRGARACYFHQRMFSVGTFSCQPGETSHWRKPVPPNGFFFTIPSPGSDTRASPSPEDEHQQGWLFSPMFKSNKSNCLENT